jgi:hypothetical protein
MNSVVGLIDTILRTDHVGLEGRGGDEGCLDLRKKRTLSMLDLKFSQQWLLAVIHVLTDFLFGLLSDPQDGGRRS